MQTIILYKYTRADGGTTTSTTMPDVEYTLMYRIAAEDGYMLTKNGKDLFYCVDVENKEGWYEIKDVESLTLEERIVALEAQLTAMETAYTEGVNNA